MSAASTIQPDNECLPRNRSFFGREGMHLVQLLLQAYSSTLSRQRSRRSKPTVTSLAWVMIMGTGDRHDE